MPIHAPIYESIVEYVRSGVVPFHMPGHKMGKGLPSAFRSDFAQYDLTEIPGLDDLHMPEGPVLEASRLAAEAFGAGNTYFLVNGSTCGIQAAITAACKPGDRILAGRDCHGSAVSGIMLAGAEPVFVKPAYQDHFGLTAAVAADDIEKALSENPDINCVFITRPNYYGVCGDIEAIARVVRSHGKLLIVDEAHGAHLCFNKRFPVPALEAGADIVVQSAHKTLPAFTQGAYLHIGKGCGHIRRRLEQALRIFQTSSPSYVILASLDTARAHMGSYGEELLEMLLDDLRHVKNLEGLRFLCDSDFKPGDGCSGGSYPAVTDPSRIVLHAADSGFTGFQAFDLLRDDFKIQAEMADLFNCVFITTVADGHEDIARLTQALSGLLKHRGHVGCVESGIFEDMRSLSSGFYRSDIPQTVLTYRDSFASEGSFVHIGECAGRICKEMLIPYPPGIPAVFPGEMITRACADYIKQVANAGGRIYGLHKGCMACVI